jgi:pumilio RNA-binding family
MNSQGNNNPKKYSGFFIENDGLTCFAEKAHDNGQQANQEPEPQDEANDSNSYYNNSYNTNNYYNMYGGYQNNMFPMINMPLLNMMSLQNMYMDQGTNRSAYDSSFNEFMTLPLE